MHFFISAGEAKTAAAVPAQRALSRQAGATLGTAGGQDRATGTRTHAKTETMRLGPPTIVRLERALTHR